MGVKQGEYRGPMLGLGPCVEEVRSWRGTAMLRRSEDGRFKA